MLWNNLELPEQNVYFKDDDTVIYCADCKDILPLLPKVDLVLTDPPFNAGKDFANDSLSLSEWILFCEWFSLNIKADNILVEVNKKDSEMRIALDGYHKYRYAICLNYTNSMRNGTIGYHNWGLVYWYGKGKCHKRYKDRIDSALHSTKKEFEHPSPKEITHYKKLTEMFSPENGIICDPFLGSGTTAVAAKKLGRKCIGIEISEKYCQIAVERLRQSVMRLE